MTVKGVIDGGTVLCIPDTITGIQYLSRFESSCTGSTHGKESSSTRGPGKELAWIVTDNVEKYFRLVVEL
jgi:hypothetical protein